MKISMFAITYCHIFQIKIYVLQFKKNKFFYQFPISARKIYSLLKENMDPKMKRYLKSLPAKNKCLVGIQCNFSSTVF